MGKIGLDGYWVPGKLHCPYPGPVRGEDNEPANVRGTAEYADGLWGEPIDRVEAQLAENFERLFGSPP